MGSPGSTGDDDRIQAKLKSLDHELLLSARREDSLKAVANRSAVIIKVIDERLAQREIEIKITRIYYGKLIKARQSYTATELDTFLTKRYPRPGLITPDTSLERSNDSDGVDSVRFSQSRIQETPEGQSGLSSESQFNVGDDIDPLLYGCGGRTQSSFNGGEVCDGYGVPTDLDQVQTTEEPSDWRWSVSSGGVSGEVGYQ